MSKNILIDTTNNIETRIAVTDDGKLDDFEIETNKKNAVKGDVYLAKITRIEPSLQAAFVDFGTNRNGFLPLTEIHPDYFKIPAVDEQKIKELNDKINNEKEEDDLNNSENVNELDETDADNIETKSEEEQEQKTIEITYGYSRDKRPDFKLFMMDLICTNDGDVPLWMRIGSGNESDQKQFVQAIKDFKNQLNFDSLMVADSAI